MLLRDTSTGLRRAARTRAKAKVTAVWLCVCLAVGASSACHTTVDSLGYNGPAGTVLHPLTGPAAGYPNAFRDVLGKSDADISAKIAAAFAQLFHGDPTTEAIYFPVGDDQAYIQDILHGDVRTEGIGYGMIIAVELDERDEFDRLWTYATAKLETLKGSSTGYFLSSCDTPPTATMPCFDSFGMEQLLMALLFANDRWGSSTGAIDYGAGAKDLLNVMRHQQDQNGGVVDGVTDVFDATSRLAYEIPNVSAANQTSPPTEMPAYYDLWAQATGDPFWTKAAASGRAYWKQAANPATGLLPSRAYFDGTPVAGWDTFAQDGYRAQLNMVLDQIWSGSSTWDVDEADRLLRFFISQGSDQYGGAYTLDGATVLDPMHENALVVVNGMTALIATVDQRAAFIDAVWNLVLPTGTARYYAGILDLLGLLVLSGQFRVY